MEFSLKMFTSTTKASPFDLTKSCRSDELSRSTAKKQWLHTGHTLQETLCQDEDTWNWNRKRKSSREKLSGTTWSILHGYDSTRSHKQKGGNLKGHAYKATQSSVMKQHIWNMQYHKFKIISILQLFNMYLNATKYQKFVTKKHQSFMAHTNKGQCLINRA